MSCEHKLKTSQTSSSFREIPNFCQGPRSRADYLIKTAHGNSRLIGQGVKLV
jgi:hypothetical protein